MSRICECSLLAVCAMLTLTGPGWAEEKAVPRDRYGDPIPAAALARLGTVRLRLQQVAGHQDTVISLAFSPDGRRLTSGDDHTAIVWDVAQRKPLHFLPGPLSTLAVAYSPDGKIIATGDGKRREEDYEGQIRLWDAEKGSLLRQFFGHLNNVESLAFSPDGKALASGGGDARAKLWDPATGQRLHQLRVAEHHRLVAVSSDGKTLLAHGAGEPSLWAVDGGRKVRDFGPAGGDFLRFLYTAFLPPARSEPSSRGTPKRSACWPSGRTARRWLPPAGKR